MSGATCGTWFAGAVVAPDAVVLVDSGETAADGGTAAGTEGFNPAPALQTLQKTFPASKIVFARRARPQASSAEFDSDASSLDEAFAALAQAGEKNILVQPSSPADREALLLLEEVVANWRARKTFRRLSLAKPPAANPGADSAAISPTPDDIAEQAELGWWGRDPWFRRGR